MEPTAQHDVPQTTEADVPVNAVVSMPMFIPQGLIHQVNFEGFHSVQDLWNAVPTSFAHCVAQFLPHSEVRVSALAVDAFVSC